LRLKPRFQKPRTFREMRTALFKRSRSVALNAATEIIEQFPIATLSACAIAAALPGQQRVTPRYLFVVCLLGLHFFRLFARF
jgi:hypothetical protein